MNYQAVYNSLIEKAQTRISQDGYTERHHIIPKSLGGGDEQSNLVRLTAREHFVAHLLLAKIYGEKMIYAAWMMMNANKKKYNNRQYAWVREQFVSLQTYQMTGTTRSDETKRKMSEVAKNKQKTEKHCQNISEGRKGIVFSEDTKNKMSISHTGKKQSPETVSKRVAKNIGKKRSDETKQKMSKAQSGRVFSEEHIRKLSEARRNRVITDETKRKISESMKAHYATRTNNPPAKQGLRGQVR